MWEATAGSCQTHYNDAVFSGLSIAKFAKSPFRVNLNIYSNNTIITFKPINLTDLHIFDPKSADCQLPNQKL